MARARLPVFPLDTVLYPGGFLPLRIFETRYVDMVSRCLKDSGSFVVASMKREAGPGEAIFHDIATRGRIVDFEQLPDGLLGITVGGEMRVRLSAAKLHADGLNMADAEDIDPELPPELPERCADLRELLDGLLDKLPDVYGGLPRKPHDAGWVSYRLAEILPMNLTQKQFFLELDDPIRRLDILRPLLDSLEMLENGSRGD